MNDRHEMLDLAPAYALGALDPEDEERFETHLADCSRCRAALEGYRAAVGRIADAAPRVEPPPEIREKILRSAGGSPDAPEIRPPAARAEPSRRGTWTLRLAAAAALILAFGAGWAYLQERQELMAVAEAYEDAVARVAQRDSLLDLVLAPDVRTVQLTSTDQPPTGHLFWNQGRNALVLTVHDLPPPPAGRTYQLWGIPAGDDPVGLDVFQPTADGEAVVTVQLPVGLDMAVSAVTEEPEGGSDQPTTQPFLVAEWPNSS